MTDKDTLRDHYAALANDEGFVAFCRMTLPEEELAGKRVLDLGCRRGKGVFKLSSMVGAEGSVIGVDWDEDLLEQARAAAPQAMEKNGFTESNLEFRFAYPEDLSQAGLEDLFFDVVYMNSVFNLVHDQEAVLAEIFRVLVSGGMLILETAVANGPRDEAVVAQARSLGNPIQAAPYTGALIRDLMMAGFAQVEALTVEEDLPADRGVTEEVAVPVVETDEQLAFDVFAFHAHKV